MTFNDTPGFPYKVEDVYPMSDIEKGMIYASLLNPDNPVYQNYSIFEMGKKYFNYKLFEQAFELAVEKHSILRTGFNLHDYDEPAQIVYHSIPINIDYTVKQDLDSGQLRAWLDHYIEMDKKVPFDMSGGEPLWRLRLFESNDGRVFILWVYHHAMIDGWSSASLFEEIRAITIELSRNPRFKPIPLKHSYKDYVIHEIIEKQNPDNAAYWQEELGDYERMDLAALQFPGVALPRSGGMELRQYRLEGDLGQRLRRASVSYRSNPRTLCFAACLALFDLMSFGDDVVLGIVTNSRPPIEDGDKLIGCFLNTVPVRMAPSGFATWGDYVTALDVKLRRLKKHEKISLFEIARLVGTQSDDRNPFFDVLFNYMDYSALVGEGNAPVVENGVVRAPVHMTNTTFDFEVSMTGGVMILSLKYRIAEVCGQFVEKCRMYFQRILGQLLGGSDCAIDYDVFISEEERRDILDQFNDTERDYSRNKTLAVLLDEQLARAPERVAMYHAGGEITYEQLHARASAIAAAIRANGGGNGKLVGIMMNRCPGLVESVVGIIKGGDAYVPFEPYLPPNRVKKIVADLGIEIMITNSDSVPRAREIADGCPHNVAVIDCETVPETEQTITSRAEPDDLAYIIFTSGSTGTPKGVTLTHSPVVNVIEWVNRTFGVGEGHKLLFVTSIGFDLSVYDVFGIFAAGGSIRLAVEEEIKGPMKLLDIIMKEGITFWDSAPAALQQLVPFLPQVKEYREQSRMRLVFLSGDWIPLGMPPALKKAFPGVNVISLGGATEAAIWSNFYPVKEMNPAWNSVPYGKPIQNAAYYILDKRMRVCPVGVPGDLYIGGRCLALEYRNDPQLTAAKFLPNPFRPGERIYRTGDMARWFADGNMEFLGRKDHQVKIRGFRIELGEIESWLVKHDAVESGIVLDRENKDGTKYLCAYIVSDDTVDSEQLKRYLQKELPEYMIPSYFIQLDEIPQTANGKLDRKALPEPELGGGGRYEAPRDEVERQVADIWAQVLGLDTAVVGADSGFFELGGHSLNAAVAISRVHKAFDVKMPLAEMFRDSSVRGVADYIRDARWDAFQAIRPVEDMDYYPLSSAQKRLFFLQTLEPRSVVYNLPQFIPMQKSLDLQRLRQVLRHVLRRHESFRTTFHLMNGEPKQRILPSVDIEIRHIHKHEFDIHENEPLTQQDAFQMFVRPFDLSQAPLLRVGYMEHGNERVLLVDMHHIVSDGVSHHLLYEEIVSLYGGGSLPEPALRYRDYAVWQEREKSSLQSQEAFWLSQFKGAVPVLDMPLDRQRPPARDYSGRAIGFMVAPEDTARLKQLANDEHATLFMMLLTVFYLFLAKLSNQDDIVIGTPVAGRRHPSLERLIGMFVNTLALRVKLAGGDSCLQFIHQVKETCLQAFDNQEYPFEDLVDRVEVKRDAARNPLFDVVFMVQNKGEFAGVIPKCGDDDIVDANGRLAMFDLTLNIVDAGERLYGEQEYCDSLFERSSVEHFVRYFKRVLAELASAPQTPLEEIQLITAQERVRLARELGRLDVGYPSSETIHQVFNRVAAKQPDQVAVSLEERQWTYDFLNRRASTWAARLRDHGVVGECIVGLMVEPSIDMLLGIMAILMAGGAYMPLDPGYPPERLRYMLRDSGVSLLLTGRSVKAADLFDGTILCLEDEIDEIEEGQLPAVDPGNAAYVIYTSGTTGFPKGMVIEHRNVIRLLFNDENLFDFSTTDCWSMFHSYCFDFSVWEMYGALLNGGRLAMVPPLTARDPEAFRRLLARQRVTVLNQTPSAFYHLSETVVASGDLGCSLRYVIFGGESLRPAKLADWRKRFPSVRLINMYGITETTVHVSFKEVDECLIERDVNNIGVPIPTLGMYIVGPGDGLQPPGVEGEILVGGLGVGRGYLNRPELTDRKFVPVPFLPGERLYRSGDLGRVLPGGHVRDIEYRGRCDHQVKIRGYRIELAEIENSLLEIDGIAEAVVASRPTRDGNNELVAFVTFRPAEEGAVSVAADIKTRLAGRLPDYMIPSSFIRLQGIPRLPNGKIDRKNLPLDMEAMDAAAGYRAPENEMERLVASIWQEELNAKQVGILDNFFDLGGHSFNIIKVHQRLKQALNTDIPLVAMFSYPTVKELSGYLSQGQELNMADDAEIDESLEVMEQTFGNFLGDDDDQD